MYVELWQVHWDAWFYMVLANFGLSLQTTHVIDFVPILNEQGRGVVVSRLLEQLPASQVFLVAFGAIALISYITGHCTVGYALGFATQNGQIVRVNRHSGTWHFG